MTTPSNPPSAGTPPRKILVVDDDEVILKTLSFKLKSSGCQVCTAMDGPQAVSAVRKEKPDLILLDISFPTDVGVTWDGFGIISWLKRLDETKKTPIIVISGSDPAQVKQRALQAGAVAFFQKPIDHDDLVKMIRQTLDRGSSSAPRPGGG